MGERKYEYGRCSTMSACEGEWDAVWVSGVAAQESLLFSSSHAGWEEEICSGPADQADSDFLDRFAGRCELRAGGGNAGVANTRQRANGREDGGTDALRAADGERQSEEREIRSREGDRCCDRLQFGGPDLHQCPQWFAGDFAEQDQPEPVEEDEMEEMAKAESEEVLGEVGQGAVAREQVIEKVVSTAPMVREEIRPERVVVKRKKAGPRRLEDEPPSLAKTLLLRLGLPLTPPQEGEALG